MCPRHPHGAPAWCFLPSPPCTQVVGLGGAAPDRAIIHAPLAVLPVAFPEARFNQVGRASTGWPGPRRVGGGRMGIPGITQVGGVRAAAPAAVSRLTSPRARGAHRPASQAVECMQQFSSLVDMVAQDEDYLEATLAQVGRRGLEWKLARPWAAMQLQLRDAMGR
jgi:hypothetical protein